MAGKPWSRPVLDHLIVFFRKEISDEIAYGFQASHLPGGTGVGLACGGQWSPFRAHGPRAMAGAFAVMIARAET